ncbi:hypothetical protein EV191_1011088 [Tamaricihabitans halophyticus]|uniref:NB-ARC domain-containing protein n=1 Tax=Tamaricihabitans halophyticus TaxID=1262583 RepID=A0A4V2SV45_9PSEU|nr:hypothetical protein [Tamaricihabitans halophyticus]TCP57136.1 hypothetical protein EV191_1011088 [Tamaricihabitans halophyticus]
MDELTRDMLTQVTGIMLTELYTKSKDGLVKVFRAKRGEPSVDQEALAEQVRELAEQDPEWAAELGKVLAARSAISRHPRALPAPNPLRDRMAALAQTPDGDVTIISGRSGSGRGAFTRHYAEVHRERFHRAVLEINLDEHRIGGEEVNWPGVYREQLGELGIADTDIAEKSAELKLQFRKALLAGNVLIILRGARGMEEIVPFEPAHPANQLLVCTDQLTGELRLHYTCVVLAEMDAEGAWLLLADHCRDRAMLEREPAAVAQLLDLAGYLPEPIQYLGLELRLGTTGSEPVARLVNRLRERGLAHLDAVLGAAIDQSLEKIDPRLRQAITLLAGCCARGFDHQLAGIVLNQDEADTSRTLRQLRDLHLVNRTGATWFRVDEPVRGQLLATLDEPGQAQCTDAYRRVIGHLRDRAVTADVHGKPDRLRLYPERFQPVAESAVDSIRWVLLDAVHKAAELGMHLEVCQLGGALEISVLNDAQYGWYQALNEVVLESARQLLAGEPADQHRAMLARAYAMQARMFFLRAELASAKTNLELAWQEFGQLPEDNFRRLRASMHEFHGRYEEIRAKLDSPDSPDLREAVAQLNEAVRIDRADQDGAALVIHLRMLANILVEQRGSPMELLDEAQRLPQAAGRNLARIHMVRTKVHDANGQPDWGQYELNRARDILAREGNTQYEWEIAELSAGLASAAGQFTEARRIWGGLAEAAIRAGLPRLNRYLAELKALAEH